MTRSGKPVIGRTRVKAGAQTDGNFVVYDKDITLGAENMLRATSRLHAVRVSNRLKTIPSNVGEKPVLKVRFDTMIPASARWWAMRVTRFARHQMEAVGRELDQNCEAETIAVLNPQPIHAKPRFPVP